jgi:hypothetical protein
MSASARFLLEFAATGDQEVVNKIREVGAAGQEAASQLESLQGIEDPFAAVGAGAEGAIAPITEVGSATGELGGIFGEAGSATEEFGGALTGMNTEIEGVAGGLTDANTVVGEFGTSAGSATSGIGQMSGAIVGLGGTIGTAISTVYRMQDAQLALDKAHLKAAKSTESARKAQVGFDTLLKSATGNTQAITAARNELSAAQDALNQMQEAGITSGAEYEAAQARVGAATAALRGEFVQGGGDANKFDAALNKVSISQDAMTIAAKNLEKATREYGTTQLETGLAVAGFVGTAIQAVSSLKNIKDGAKTLSPLLGAIGKAMAGTTGAAKLLAAGIGALAVGFGAFIGVMTAIDQNVGGVKDALKGVHNEANKAIPALSGMFDYLGKTFATNTEGFGKWGAEVQKMLGIPVAEGPKAAAGLKKVSTAAVDTTDKLTGIIDATNGNTTAIAALQRTHGDLQMNIDRSGTSLDDFQKIMYKAKSEMDGTASSTDTFNSALDAVNAGMGRSTEEAAKLSNVFPEMGANIENALLGQEQNMGIAINLWNDFNERVKQGQYETGEFTKYIKDMGYELTPGVEAAVGAIDDMTLSIEEARASIPGAVGEISSAISEGNQEMYDSGQLLEQNLSDEEKAVRSLQEQTSKNTAEYLKNKKAKEDAAEASRKLAESLISEAGSAANAADAIAESHLTYAKSVDAVADMNAVLSDQKAHQEAVATAVNKTIESEKQEQITLEAAIAATQNKVIQDQKLTNAKLEGTKAAMEFISSLDEEKAKQEANIAVLRQSVSAMGVFGDNNLRKWRPVFLRRLGNWPEK